MNDNTTAVFQQLVQNRARALEALELCGRACFFQTNYRLSVKFKVCFALPYVFTPVTKLRCPPQNRDWLPSKEDEQVPTARHESPR